MAHSQPCQSLSLLLLLAVAEGVTLQSTGRVGSVMQDSALDDSDRGSVENFSEFMRQHGRSYRAGTREYSMRLGLFQAHLAAVHTQNSDPQRKWTAAVNKLADRTTVELAMLRGYRHGARAPGSAMGGAVGLVSTAVRSVDVSKLPADWTWQPHLRAMQEVVDQGGCGSCWAVSSATTLRAHAQLFQKDRKFSAQQIVACTQNPKQCGGKGGCEGATAELAMDYAAKQMVVLDEEMAYTGTNGKCPEKMVLLQEKPKSLRSALASLQQQQATRGDVTIEGGGGSKYGMVGWRKLPENKAEPLLLAVYEEGPVVVSVAAGGEWSMYSSGVMNACDKGAVINHAVVLTGFGKDAEQKVNYWQIQNSWGPDWGEQGFVRLLRHETKEEDAYCGWDKSPQDGTACKGGPEKVWVCGSCGILYDSVVPKFRLGEQGWWHTHGNRSVTA